jgi:hypothetical protein
LSRTRAESAPSFVRQSIQCVKCAAASRGSSSWPEIGVGCVVFDPMKHSFNPLKGIEYERARELAELFYTIFPQGDNTLTVRNGKRALLKALLKADRL